MNLVDTNQIVISGKFKHSHKTTKCFTSIVLSQMSGYIKYFENGGKSLSFKIDGDDVLIKYREIWKKSKGKPGIKFHSNPVYDKNT